MLSIATVVGASVPSFAPWLLAAACYVVAGVQSIGFIGVFKVREVACLYLTCDVNHLV